MERGKVYSSHNAWPSVFSVWNADMLSEYAARPNATEASTFGSFHMEVATPDVPSSNCPPTMSSGITRLCTRKFRSRPSSVSSRRWTPLNSLPAARGTGGALGCRGRDLRIARRLARAARDDAVAQLMTQQPHAQPDDDAHLCEEAQQTAARRRRSCVR